MRGVAVLTITGVLSQLVGFVYRIGLTRLAGAEILGLYQLILPVYSVLLSLTSVGLTTAVSNLSAWYQALGNQRAIYQVRGQAVKLFFLLALMPCSLLLLFSDGASVYLLGDARTQLGLILLVPCLLLTGTENLQKHYFYGTGRVYPAAITELAEQVLRSLLVLALLWRLAPDTAEKAVGTIVLGMALCEVVSALTQTVLFRVYLGPPAGLSGEKLTPKALRGKIGRIALPLGFAALLGNLISSANAVLIPRLLVQGGMDQGEAVSAYGVTFGMTLPMLLLPTAFLSALGLVLTPKLSQYSALGQKEAIRRQVKRSVGAANLILIPALALLAVLGSAIGQSLYRDDRVGESPAAGPGGALLLLADPLGLRFERGQPPGGFGGNRPGRGQCAAGAHLPDGGPVGHGGVCLQLCPVSPAGSGAQLAGGFPGNWAFPAGVFLVYRPHPGRLPGGLLRGFDGDGAASGRPGLLSRRGGGTVLWTAALFGGPAGHGGREQRGRTAAISFTGSIKGQQPFLSKRGCCFLLLGKSAGSISCRESLLLARLHTFHFSLV